MSHTAYPDFHFEDVALLTDIVVSRDFSTRRKEGVKAAWCLAGHIAGRTVGEPDGINDDDGGGIVIAFNRAAMLMTSEQLSSLEDLEVAMQTGVRPVRGPREAVDIGVLIRIASVVLPWILEKLLSKPQ